MLVTPDTPATPARLARRTSNPSIETKVTPFGLLHRCSASANSIPCSVSARTLVSAAVMTASDFRSDCGSHRRQGLRFALEPQATRNRIQISFREEADRAQQNAVSCFLDDLAFGGEPCGFHSKTTFSRVKSYASLSNSFSESKPHCCASIKYFRCSFWLCRSVAWRTIFPTM